MLKIQVLGKGLIPRGLGLAPRKTPFDADLTLITTILNTNGLSINFVHPEDGRLIPLNRRNCKRIWDKYNNFVPTASATNEVDECHPHVPDTAPVATGETVMTNPPVVERDVIPEKVKDSVESNTPAESTELSEATSTSAETSIAEETATAENSTDATEDKPESNTFRPVNAPDNNNRNNNGNNNRNNGNHKNNNRH